MPIFSVAFTLLALGTPPKMYGIDYNLSLVSIDLESGTMAEISAAQPEELMSQELSAIDVKRSRYYTVGVNKTGNRVNLVAWSLDSGHQVRQVELPFFVSSVFVGMGEALDVDPTDGTVIVMGHDASRGGSHCVHAADAASLEFKFVADIGGDMHTDLLSASTAYDHDARVAYVAIAYNDSSPHAAVRFAAVSLDSGAVANVSTSLIMSGLAYDGHTKRLYGTVVKAANGTSFTMRTLVAAAAARRAAARSGARAHGAPHSAGALAATRAAAGVLGLPGGPTIARRLAYFETANPSNEPIEVGSPLPLTGAVGDVHTFDAASRVHYTLLMGKLPPAPPYAPTDFCKAHGEACPAGSSCCCPPPCTDAAKCAPRRRTRTPRTHPHAPAPARRATLPTGARASKANVGSLRCGVVQVRLLLQRPVVRQGPGGWQPAQRDVLPRRRVARRRRARRAAAPLLDAAERRDQPQPLPVEHPGGRVTWRGVKAVDAFVFAVAHAPKPELGHA